MKNKHHIARSAIGVLLSCVMLSGCAEVQIFEHKDDKAALVAVSAKDLEKNTYYVKNGTKFYRTLPPNSSAMSFSSAVNEKRIICAPHELDDAIPSHYVDEIVAYTTDKTGIESVVLERYKDMGWSLGVHNGTFDKEENTLGFEYRDSVVKESDAGKIFGDLESTKIRIAAIDGRGLTKDDIDSAGGIIINLEKDKEYTVSFYAGTYYHEEKIKADTHLFQSYEIYNYDDTYISDTRNGYIAFNTPDDLKNGYYLINGQGFFRYFDHERGGNDDVDMNESYYASEEERIAAYSRQYSFVVNSATKNMNIEFLYETDEETEDSAEVRGYVYAPDKTRYIMDHDEEKKRLSLDLAEATPGKWTVNIIPLTLNITNYGLKDDAFDQQLTQESNQVVLESPRTNIVFKVYYTNDINADADEIEINGSIVGPDGETFPMEKAVEKDEITKEEKLLLKYAVVYAQAGTYRVNVNHYPTRTTVQPPVITDNTQTETDIIMVEE